MIKHTNQQETLFDSTHTHTQTLSGFFWTLIRNCCVTNRSAKSAEKQFCLIAKFRGRRQREPEIDATQGTWQQENNTH